jgi:hypothetical protein
LIKAAGLCQCYNLQRLFMTILEPVTSYLKLGT